MKIALINTTLNHARGSDLVVHNLASMLSSHHDVTVFAPFGANIPSAGYSLIAPPVKLGLIGKWLHAIKILLNICKEASGFDVLNCHHALLSLSLPSRRLITTYHGYRGRLNFIFGSRVAHWISEAVRRLPVRHALRRSQIVTLVSHSLEEEASKAKTDSIYVIYNGVSLPEARANLQDQIGDYFLYVGRIDPDKSVDELIKLYCATSVQTPLWIVGDGTDRKTIETACQDKRVRFLGTIERSKLYNLFAGSRAFVTASPYETFCLPVIEAALAGRPALGPKSGSLPEVICHGETGYLYDSSNFEFYLNKLSAMSVDDAKQMAKVCTAWANRFSWLAVAENYMSVYRRLTESQNCKQQVSSDV